MLRSVLALREGRIRKAAQASSRKGCMTGKGGPQNASCTFKGVRQRTWGKWVAEIREPNGGARMWLGTFDNSYDAAVAYDAAARKLYGPHVKVNLPHLYEQNNQYPVLRRYGRQLHIQEHPVFVSSQCEPLPATHRHPSEGALSSNTTQNVKQTDFLRTEEMLNNLNAYLPEVDDSAQWAEAAKDTTFHFVEHLENFTNNLGRWNDQNDVVFQWFQ